MGEDRTGQRRETDLDRLTVLEAASVLNVTQDAIRKRIARGTIRHEKGENGRVFVYVSKEEADDAWSKTETKTDQDKTRGASKPPSERDALISAKDETIRMLGEQLAEERRAHAETRSVLMAALDKMPPAIEAPRSPIPMPGASETTEPRPASEGSPEASEAPQGEERRGFWRRLFGG